MSALLEHLRMSVPTELARGIHASLHRRLDVFVTKHNVPSSQDHESEMAREMSRRDLHSVSSGDATDYGD